MVLGQVLGLVQGEAIIMLVGLRAVCSIETRFERGYHCPDLWSDYDELELNFPFGGAARGM